MDNLLLLWYILFVGLDYTIGIRLALIRLAASFDNISTAANAAVAKLDPQNGIAPSSHVVLVTCVKNLYRCLNFLGYTTWVTLSGSVALLISS